MVKRAFRFKSRRFRRRRRTYGRRSFSKRVKRVVYRMSEKKYIDIVVNGAVGTTGGLIHLTRDIPTGNSRANRIGNKIHCRYILPRLEIDSELEDGVFYRVALVRHKTLGLTEGDLPVGGNGVSDFIDIEKFQVISDVVYNLGDADTNGMNKRLHRRSHRIMRQCTYDSSTTGTQITNIFSLFLWSNDLITTGQNVVGNVRVYFTDL